MARYLETWNIAYLSGAIVSELTTYSNVLDDVSAQLEEKYSKETITHCLLIRQDYTFGTPHDFENGIDSLVVRSRFARVPFNDPYATLSVGYQKECRIHGDKGSEELNGRQTA